MLGSLAAGEFAVSGEFFLEPMWAGVVEVGGELELVELFEEMLPECGLPLAS